jgi:hypothetical protein
MDSQDLREQLNKLHTELSGAEHVDAQNRRLLGEVMQDIKRLLESPDSDGGGAGVPSASLAQRLENLAVQFEADHPALAVSTRRFVDLLVKVGL